MTCGNSLMLIPRCENVRQLVCGFYRMDGKVFHREILRAVWSYWRNRTVGWI